MLVGDKHVYKVFRLLSIATARVRGLFCFLNVFVLIGEPLFLCALRSYISLWSEVVRHSLAPRRSPVFTNAAGTRHSSQRLFPTAEVAMWSRRGGRAPERGRGARGSERPGASAAAPRATRRGWKETWAHAVKTLSLIRAAFAPSLGRLRRGLRGGGRARGG